MKAIVWRVLTLRYEGVGMKGIRDPCSPRCNDGRSMWEPGDACFLSVLILDMVRISSELERGIA